MSKIDTITRLIGERELLSRFCPENSSHRFLVVKNPRQGGYDDGSFKVSHEEVLALITTHLRKIDDQLVELGVDPCA
jgi:hypothetical protein